MACFAGPSFQDRNASAADWDSGSAEENDAIRNASPPNACNNWRRFTFNQPPMVRLMLVVSLLLHQQLHCLVHGEAAWPLSRWKFLERLQVLAHDCLSRDQHKRMFYEPRIICTRLVFPTIERIRTHVEDLRGTQSNHWLHPDL